MQSLPPAQGGEGLLPEYLSLSFFFAGDAPFCTPEQHKECAEPALGQYQGPDGMMGEGLRSRPGRTSGCSREMGGRGVGKGERKEAGKGGIPAGTGEGDGEEEGEEGGGRELMQVVEGWKPD